MHGQPYVNHRAPTNAQRPWGRWGHPTHGTCLHVRLSGCCEETGSQLRSVHRKMPGPPEGPETMGEVLWGQSREEPLQRASPGPGGCARVRHRRLCLHPGSPQSLLPPSDVGLARRGCLGAPPHPPEALTDWQRQQGRWKEVGEASPLPVTTSVHPSGPVPGSRESAPWWAWTKATALPARWQPGPVTPSGLGALERSGSDPGLSLRARSHASGPSPDAGGTDLCTLHTWPRNFSSGGRARRTAFPGDVWVTGWALAAANISRGFQLPSLSACCAQGAVPGIVWDRSSHGCDISAGDSGSRPPAPSEALCDLDQGSCSLSREGQDGADTALPSHPQRCPPTSGGRRVPALCGV